MNKLDIKNKLKDKNLWICVSLAIILIISIIIFLKKPSKEFRNLQSVSKAISNINLENNLETTDISSKVYIDSLNSKLEQLTSIKESLSKMEKPKDYVDLHSQLSTGLDNNILCYDQLIKILSDSSKDDIASSYDEAINLKNKCEDSYSFCRENNLPVYISKDSNNFLDNIFYYINQLIKLDRDNDIRTTQKNDFLVSLDGVRKNFSPIQENLFLPIEKIREDKRDLNAVVEDVYKKINNFENAKSEFYSISVPSNGKEIFSNLESAFSIGSIYLNSMLKGLTEEIENSNSDNKFYEDAKAKLSDLDNTLKTFDDSFDKYKKN